MEPAGRSAALALLSKTAPRRYPGDLTQWWAVDKADAKTKRGVVAAINAASGTSTPAWCYTVLVNQSSSRWATYQFSAKASRNPQRCQVHDGTASFYYRTSNGKWVYAGDGPGWRKTKCTFTVEPSASVARDFGCRWWKVVT